MGASSEASHHEFYREKYGACSRSSAASNLKSEYQQAPISWYQAAACCEVF
jgi:hypothetical protein